jgi:hypothetical protein
MYHTVSSASSILTDGSEGATVSYQYMKAGSLREFLKAASDGVTLGLASHVPIKLGGMTTADRVLTTNTSGVVSQAQVSTAMIAADAVGSSELKSAVSLIIYNSAGSAIKTLYGAGS